MCHGCPLPVVGEDGAPREVRACTEGPVVRGDRVRWADLTGDPWAGPAADPAPVRAAGPAGERP
nr:hypothetical protein [Nocardioides perillae]